MSIGNHFHEAHGRRDLLNESHFKILRKCQGKFDCLVFEMLFNKKFYKNLQKCPFFVWENNCWLPWKQKSQTGEELYKF